MNLRTWLTLIMSMAAATAACADDACPAMPEPQRDLKLERFYNDAAGSVVDPAKMEAHKAATAPLTSFVGFITKQADRANSQRSSPLKTAECALSWIRRWAEGGAYLGQMDSKQSHAQRRWDLAGIAFAYLKLKHFATAQERAAIEPWLTNTAAAARADFENTGIKRNNHWYWMGLGLAATGLATDSGPHWQEAKDIFAAAANDIAADGTLPLELERKGRALHYHVFALEPLVVLAELAAVRGEDWYALNDGALHRLVAKTVEGLIDPAVFDRLAGAVQERPVKSGYGWASLYRDRHFSRMPEAIDQPAGHRWLGGDTRILLRAAARKAP